jgi:hypothetical protein
MHFFHSKYKEERLEKNVMIPESKENAALITGCLRLEDLRRPQ